MTSFLVERLKYWEIKTNTKSINSYHNKLLNYKISFQNLTNTKFRNLKHNKV